jgi:hypothetical protein
MSMGHIRLNRNFVDHPVWSDDKLLSIFVKLIFRANYKPQETIYKNRLYKIDRGEFSTSWPKLSEYLKVNQSFCRRSIVKLKNFGFITVKSDNAQTTIKINDYDSLCSHESDERQASEQASEQASDRQVSRQVTPIKEFKNLRTKETKKERKKPSPETEAATEEKPENVKPKKEPSPVSKVIAHYCELFKQQYGITPKIGGKESGSLKRLCDNYGEEKALAIVQRYFRLNDKWLADQAYPVSLIDRNINKILVMLDGSNKPKNPWSDSGYEQL